MIKILSLLVLVSSCSSSVKVISGGCPNKLHENEAKPKYTLEKKIWSSASSLEDAETYSVRDIFKSHGIDCEKLNYVSYQVGQTGGDVFMSLIPFKDRMSINVYGY